MATITRIKNKSGVVFRVHVHVNGKRESARFKTKPEAAQWAYEREIALRKDNHLVEGKTMADAFRRFSGEIPDSKKGKRWDLVRLNKFCSDPIANVPASDLKIEDGEDFIHRAVVRGLAPNTIIREMGLMKTVVRQMVRWKWLSEYPWQSIKLPKAGKRRTKLYTKSEIALILEHAGLDDACDIETKMQEVAIAFIVATQSGMRLNEICSIRSSWWNKSGRVISLPASITKTDTSREVPLSTVATDALSRLTERSNGMLFNVDAQSASTFFRRIRLRAGIKDGTFHDSRHYAVTHLARKLDVLSLARVIGHSNIQELMTYYEADAVELATKLD